MNNTKKKKVDSGCRYRITSKSKIIWKLICMWAKLQSSRKQSIILACEFIRKAFGEGDLIESVTKSQNENALIVMREFTSDICSVGFNSNSSDIPDNIEVWFYKDTDSDSGLFDWLKNQTSVTASVSFAIYAFIRTFGIKDTMSVIADIVLKDKNMFDVFGLLSSDTANEPKQLTNDSEQPTDQADKAVNSVDVGSLF